MTWLMVNPCCLSSAVFGSIQDFRTLFILIANPCEEVQDMDNYDRSQSVPLSTTQQIINILQKYA